MKTKILNTVLFALLSIGGSFAQDVTTVRANSADISDNLDLKAVASIFGDSRDLEDFERRLNDPDLQISNLDLNGDNRVDYLRVIEATEGNTHLIILQSVLAADTFQDVATIEVERDRNNNVQVQVVGDVYMYGPNYIYEPVYVRRPVLFDIFWVNSYRPYYSPWYWGYYPTYYNYWAPYPVYRYRNNIYVHINSRNTYNYTNTRRSTRAMALYNTRRANAYERQHPNSGFSTRNGNASNRYALEQSRANSRSQNTSGGTRSSFNSSSRRSTSNAVRSTNINNARSAGTGNTVRATAPARSSQTIRSNETVRSAGTPSRSSNSETVRPASSAPSRSAAQPSRSNSVERSNNNVSPVRSAPAMNTPAPSRSNSTIRSTPAPSRQASPAPSRSSGGNAGRSAGSRRG